MLSMRNLNRRLSVLIILVWAAVCSAKDASLVPPASKKQVSSAVTVSQPGNASDSSETGPERIPLYLNKQNPPSASHSEQLTPASASTAKDNTEQPHHIIEGESNPYSKVSDSEADVAPQPQENNT